MSIATETFFLASNFPAGPLGAPSREGDWANYLRQLADVRANPQLAQDAEGFTSYKRQCALAYLGKRAQLRGGVCSKKPRILNAEMMRELGERNRAKRYARYPWLEKLLRLMAEIELIQEQASSSNVFSLVQTVETVDEPAHRLGLAEGTAANAAFRSASFERRPPAGHERQGQRPY